MKLGIGLLNTEVNCYKISKATLCLLLNAGTYYLIFITLVTFVFFSQLYCHYCTNSVKTKIQRINPAEGCQSPVPSQNKCQLPFSTGWCWHTCGWPQDVCQDGSEQRAERGRCGAMGVWSKMCTFEVWIWPVLGMLRQVHITAANKLLARQNWIMFQSGLVIFSCNL